MPLIRLGNYKETKKKRQKKPLTKDNDNFNTRTLQSFHCPYEKKYLEVPTSIFSLCATLYIIIFIQKGILVILL